MSSNESNSAEAAAVAPWRKALALRFKILLYLTGALSLLGWVAGTWQPAELSTHFRPHYFLVLACGALWLLARRRWRTFVPVFLLALLNGASVVPWYVAPAEQASALERKSVRLLLANVLTTNAQHGLILEQIEREDPDIVILQETNVAWLVDLQSLEASYPYRISVPRDDNFGIALYSRLPLGDLRIADLGSADVPSIIGTLEVGEQPVTLIATHPLPPVSAQYFAWRNGQLEAVARLAAEQPQAIVIGDLNTTMWSPYYANFEALSGLDNVRRGFGVLPSWPVGLGPLMIPLDHCLVSAGIRTLDVRSGSDTGGDHLPLIVDLLLP